MQEERNYYNFLLSLIRTDDAMVETHTQLLYELFGTSYYWRLPMDSNRYEDGIKLRRNADIQIERPCSVLEMMIALAQRCDADIMRNPNEGNRTAFWFWSMVDNVELIRFTDDIYDPNEVGIILMNFLEGRYSSDGRGSIFFTKNHNKDFRKLDLWYQMNAWLLENFYKPWI